MESVDRFYRVYSKYISDYGSDTLFVLLDSLHSLNDKLKNSYDINLFGIDEFITLKAIRNYLHHEGELGGCLTTIPVIKGGSVLSDLFFMCLIAKTDLDRAIDSIPEKYKQKHQDTMYKTIHFYGDVANIGHVIFNMAAKLIVLLDDNEISGKSEEYNNYYDAVMSDIANGYEVTVSGKLSCHANSAVVIEDLLIKALKSSN